MKKYHALLGGTSLLLMLIYISRVSAQKNEGWQDVLLLCFSSFLLIAFAVGTSTYFTNKNDKNKAHKESSFPPSLSWKRPLGIFLIIIMFGIVLIAISATLEMFGIL